MLAYSSTTSGSSKLEEISAAYVEARRTKVLFNIFNIFNPPQIVEDFREKALSDGPEDPRSTEILLKCDEYLPGQASEGHYQNYSRREFFFCPLTSLEKVNMNYSD